MIEVLLVEESFHLECRSRASVDLSLEKVFGEDFSFLLDEATLTEFLLKRPLAWIFWFFIYFLSQAAS